MPTTAKYILAMSTVLSTCAVGLYLVYVTGFRYIPRAPLFDPPRRGVAWQLVAVTVFGHSVGFKLSLDEQTPYLPPSGAVR